METIVIRADANTEIGSGHVMRCLALGQAWKDRGGRVVFVTACQSEGLLQRLREEGFEIRVLTKPHPDPKDLEFTGGIASESGGAWVVLDGYHFDEGYQQQVRQSGHRLLVIDDMAHLPHYYADVVLNQNLHAEQLQYSCEPYTRLLLGARYIMLRREFLVPGRRRRSVPETARKILVTFGGSDPENVTLDVINVLAGVSVTGLEATVVVGPGNPHTAALDAAVARMSVPVHLARDVRSMRELMGWADMAVCSGGTTIWELAYMRVPTVAIAVSPTEEFLINGLKRYALFRTLSLHDSPARLSLPQTLAGLMRDRQTRSEMGSLGGQLVDGKGGQRVLRFMKNRGVTSEKSAWR